MINYQLPKQYRLTEKEKEEISDKLTRKTRKLAGNFLKGMFFFITIPIYIFKKLNKTGGKKLKWKLIR